MDYKDRVIASLAVALAILLLAAAFCIGGAVGMQDGNDLCNQSKGTGHGKL